MIAQHISVDALTEDLADDAVAFTPEAPVDEVLADQLSSLLSGEEGVAGRAGYVVSGPGSGADLRDLGQAALDASGGDLDTVIVRGPDSAAVVSGALSRSEIESTQGQLLAEQDYVEGLGAFLRELEGAGVGGGQWLLFAAVTVIAIAAIALSVYMSASKVKQKPLTRP